MDFDVLGVGGPGRRRHERHLDRRPGRRRAEVDHGQPAGADRQQPVLRPVGGRVAPGVAVGAAGRPAGVEVGGGGDALGHARLHAGGLLGHHAGWAHERDGERVAPRRVQAAQGHASGLGGRRRQHLGAVAYADGRRVGVGRRRPHHQGLPVVDGGRPDLAQRRRRQRQRRGLLVERAAVGDARRQPVVRVERVRRAAGVLGGPGAVVAREHQQVLVAARRRAVRVPHAVGRPGLPVLQEAHVEAARRVRVGDVVGGAPERARAQVAEPVAVVEHARRRLDRRVEHDPDRGDVAVGDRRVDEVGAVVQAAAEVAPVDGDARQPGRRRRPRHLQTGLHAPGLGVAGRQPRQRDPSLRRVDHLRRPAGGEREQDEGGERQAHGGVYGGGGARSAHLQAHLERHVQRPDRVRECARRDVVDAGGGDGRHGL